MSRASSIRTVLVTGSGGNLGRKVIERLLQSDWCERVIGVDRSAGPGQSAERLQHVEADLADPADGRWRDAVAAADTVIHLAAKNPYPNAPWDDACVSFDMTANIVLAAAASGVKRLVFASSNHVMGQYKDPPLADDLAPGGLTTALTPGPGTRWFDGREVVQGVAYAVSKLMGERLCVAQARLSGGALTAVSVRIGWCQPGENRPDTISATGIPGDKGVDHPSAERDLRWFRSMWLSNRDFVTLMERAVLADASSWPAPGIVVNGMSANAGMPWDIEDTRRLLGYTAQDDVWRDLGESGRRAARR